MANKNFKIESQNLPIMCFIRGDNVTDVMTLCNDSKR